MRDYLREHPPERDAYAMEKHRLAALYVGDTADRREAYASAKSPFLDPLIARALQLGYPRESASAGAASAEGSRLSTPDSSRRDEDYLGRRPARSIALWTLPV